VGMLDASLIDTLRPAIEAHAQADYPRECCGLVVATASGPLYRPCRNIAPAETARDRFTIDPADWAHAEDAGEILAVVHSHPDACAHASTADRAMCEQTGLPWLIIGWPSGVITTTLPTGQRLPLVGREFVHGVVDCYSLIRDYYAMELGIDLPDFPRADDWWSKGGNLYRDGFTSAGFTQVEGPPQRHDVLLMQVAARVDNHGAVYCGDGTVLHHLYGRLSSHDVYGGDWERYTTAVLRHAAVIESQAKGGMV